MADPERVTTLSQAFEYIPERKGKLPRFRLRSGITIIATEPGSESVLIRSPGVIPFVKNESPKSKRNSKRT